MKNILKNNKKTLDTLSRTYKDYKVHLMLLAFIGVVGAVLDGIGINIVIPMFSFLIGNSDVPTDSVSTLIRSVFSFLGVPFSFRFLLIFLCFMFVARAFFLALFAYARARIGSSFMYREMSGLLSKTVKAPWLFLAGQKTGYLQNTLFWDVRQMTNLLDVLAQFIQSFTGFIVYFFVALSISPNITLITIFTGLVLLVFLQPFVKKTTIVGEEKSRLEKSFSSYLAEYIPGLKIIKSSGVSEKVIGVGTDLLRRFKTAYTKSVVINTMGATLIQPLSLVFVLILFAFSYKSPGFNIAEFAVVLYLVQKIFVYLQSTQSSLHSIADHAPFADNILAYKKNILEFGDNTMAGDKEYYFKKSLDLTKVSLSYRSGPKVLSSISLSIQKGQFIGLIGSSGGGKTSLADLLLRLLKPDEGEIKMDGVSIYDIDIDKWQKSVGYVSQDLFLINATIRDNIRFYDESITDQAIEEAAKKAHIYNQIMSMPDRFETAVEDRGASLSVGQRQRIVFARALVRKPELLILDEATSSLDSESEQAIKKTIEDIRKHVTLVVIAHRISTVTSADKIIVLKDGHVIEEASPKEMLEDPNSYMSRMLSLQGSTGQTS